MENFLENTGMLAIIFGIIYACKKLLEYYDFKNSRFCEDEKVYKAADEFVHGAASDKIKAILTDCFDFDKEDADKILARSLPHRADKDGGYSEFLKSVNKVLGANVYNSHCYIR